MSASWYLEFLACPDCGSDVGVVDGKAACPRCGNPVEVSQRPLDLKARQPAPATFVFPRKFPDLAVLERIPLDRPVNKYQGPMPGRDSHELVSAMLPFLAAGAKALDLGCGPRDQAPVFGHLGFDYVGLDYNHPAADILADAHAIPFRSETFDAILSYAVLQHMYNPFLAISEIKRVLKPGGIYCGSVAQGEPFHSSFFHLTSWGFASLVETSGLTIERLWPSYDALRGLGKMGRYPRVIKAMIRALDFCHTRLPVLSVRKTFTWSEREKSLDALHRAASICFLVRKEKNAPPTPLTPSRSAPVNAV